MFAGPRRSCSGGGCMRRWKSPGHRTSARKAPRPSSGNSPSSTRHTATRLLRHPPDRPRTGHDRPSQGRRVRGDAPQAGNRRHPPTYENNYGYAWSSTVPSPQEPRSDATYDPDPPGTNPERTHERPVAGRPCATPRRSGAPVTEPVTFRHCAASPAAHVSRPADRRGDPRARTRSRGPAAVAGDPLPHRTRRCGGRDRRLGPTALTSSPASSVMSQSRDETLALVA
jgi:hypothetical protein